MSHTDRPGGQRGTSAPTRFSHPAAIAGPLALLLVAWANEVLAERPDIVWMAGADSGNVNSVASSPDGQTLASGSADLTIKVWRVSDGALLRTLMELRQVNSIAFSPDGRTLASGTGRRGGNLSGVTLWQLSDGAQLWRRDVELWEWVNSVVFSPDGQTLALGIASSEPNNPYRNKIELRRVSDGERLRTLTGHTGDVLSVTFSPDGQTLASASADRTIKIWRVSDGALLGTLIGHTGDATSVAFSPDGQTLVSASQDMTIKFWRISDGALLRTLTGHMGGVSSVAFSSDGQTLASGGSPTERCCGR